MGSISPSTKKEKALKAEGKKVEQYRAYIRRRMPDGKEVSQSKVFPTRSAAREWLRNNEADVVLQQQGKRSGKTFRQLVDLFTKAPAMKGTRYWQAAHVEFWLEQLGALRLDEVTHGEINAALAILQNRQAMHASHADVKPTGRPLTPATVNRYMGSLAAVLNYAVKLGLIDIHPMKTGKVEKLAESNGRKRILTDDEVERLLAAARASTWPMMPLFLRLLLTSAARKSEVLKLKWQEVNLAESVAILHDTKNGRARALPLVSDVKIALAEAAKVRPIASDYVFFDPRQPSRPKNIESVWTAVRKAAGLFRDRQDRLDQVCLHTTRHSAITKMLKGGANLTQAAVVSGHQTLAMLKRYEHLAAQDSVELAERLLSGKKS